MYKLMTRGLIVPGNAKRSLLLSPADNLSVGETTCSFCSAMFGIPHQEQKPDASWGLAQLYHTLEEWI